MKQLIPDWFIQILWFIAGIFATGAFWYFRSVKDADSEMISGVAAVMFAAVAAYLTKLNNRSMYLKKCRETIAKYINEINVLVMQIDEGKLTLPIKAHNEWVARVSAYLRNELDESFVTRFNDFSGLVFYGDGSEKSNLKNTINGRVQRLSQFVSELN